jgi:macrolide phosphotransferase
MKTEEIKVLASRHNLKIREPIELNEMGLDFLVAFVTEENGKKWVFRIPRRADVFVRAQNEKKILEFVRTRISVNVPDWKIVQPDLIAYPMLTDNPGLTFDSSTYAVTWHMDSKSPSYVQSLAKTLVELHRISTQEVKSAGLEVLSPSEIRKKTFEELELVRRDIGLSSSLDTRILTWLDNDALWPDYTVFGHGDLYPGHLLVNKNNSVTGIIDWTEAKVQDPAIDFTGHLTTLGEESLKSLIKHYEANGGRTWPELFAHTIESAAFSPVRYGLFALSNGSNTHLAAAKAQLT